MAQVNGDPEELDAFARSLANFVEVLNEAVGALNSSFDTLGDTWQDQKMERFEEDYRELLRHLSNFEASASEQILHLNRLADKLRDYLQS